MWCSVSLCLTSLVIVRSAALVLHQDLDAELLSSSLRATSPQKNKKQKSRGVSQAAQNFQAAVPRTIKVVNNCQETVRVGFTGGTLTGQDGSGNKWSDQTFCEKQPGLMYGSDKQCHWDTPQVLKSSARDLKSGTSLSFSLDYEYMYTSQDPHTHDQKKVNANWNGALWGATGCWGKVSSTGDSNGESCDTANCFAMGKSYGNCTAETGPQGPGPTKFEFTLQPASSGSDFYDITTLDGVNLPMSVEPVLPKHLDFAKCPGNTAQECMYWCNSAGLPKASNGLSASKWEFKTTDPMQKMLMSVVAYKSDGSNQQCNPGKGTNDGCSIPGEVCGVAHKYTYFADLKARGPVTAAIENVCGRLLGVVTYDGICKFVGTNSVSGFPSNDNAVACDLRSDMYACTGTYSRSGYNKNPTPNSGSAQTCGCPIWGNLAPATEPCLSFNTEWNKVLKPQLNVFKQAAPTTYVFPFDDKSSTFTCKAVPSQTLPSPSEYIGYTVTFCPNSGKSFSIV